MGGKEARGVATCATAAAAGSTPAAAAAAASRGPKRRAAAAAGSSPATAAAASRGPKRRAAESRGCGRGLLAGNYDRSSAARGRRSVPPPPPRCPPGTAAAAASLGPNAVPPSPVAAAVDCGPETAAAARRHVVLFKSPSVQQRRTTLPGLGADYSHPAVIGRVSRPWAGGTRDQGASREGVDHGAPSPWLQPPSPQLRVPRSPHLWLAPRPAGHAPPTTCWRTWGSIVVA